MQIDVHMLLFGFLQRFKKHVVLRRCCSEDEIEQLCISLVSDSESSDLVQLLFIEDLVLLQIVQERSLRLHLLHEECVVVDQRLPVTGRPHEVCVKN